MSGSLPSRAILTARRHRSEAHMSPRWPPRRQVGHPWRKGSVKCPSCLLLITTVCISLKYVQEGGDFSHIIEISLLFHLQLSKSGWLNFFKICSEGGDFAHIIKIALLFYLQFSKPGWPNLGQIGPPNGTFSNHISVHFRSPSQNVLKYELKKSQICPIWVSLTHIGPKSGHPGLESCKWNKGVSMMLREIATF